MVFLRGARKCFTEAFSFKEVDAQHRWTRRTNAQKQELQNEEGMTGFAKGKRGQNA